MTTGEITEGRRVADRDRRERGEVDQEHPPSVRPLGRTGQDQADDGERDHEVGEPLGVLAAELLRRGPGVVEQAGILGLLLGREVEAGVVETFRQGGSWPCSPRGPRREIDVADQSRAARAPGAIGVDPVDADVDHGSARLHPVRLDHLRTADSGNEDVGAAAHRRQVARAAVRDRDGAALGGEQLRHRLADDVRAADHDRVESGEVAQHILEQHQAAERRARHESAACPVAQATRR